MQGSGLFDYGAAVIESLISLAVTRSDMSIKTISIRVKIVALAGLCLLGIVGAVVSMNIHMSGRNNLLIAQSSEQMMIASAKSLLLSEASEQAVSLDGHFGQSLMLLTSIADQVTAQREGWEQHGGDAAAQRELLNQTLKSCMSVMHP